MKKLLMNGRWSPRAASDMAGNGAPENEYNYLQTTPANSNQGPEGTRQGGQAEQLFCPCCGSHVIHETSNGLSWSHNVETCRLVNLALSDMEISLDQSIRVDIYRSSGPLKGYYSPADPYTIHVSEEAYSRYPEYVIFHETKHLVDCIMKGWSEEDTPDPFARSLCVKHGFGVPPPHPNFAPAQFSYAPWPRSV